MSYGIDYDGTLISERQSAPEFERPSFFWAPSIAPSGLVLYRGDRYPDFADKFLVGGFAARALVRVRMGGKSGLLFEDARMYAALRQRIRDVRVGPDGLIYLLTDEERNARLLRIAPADARAPDLVKRYFRFGGSPRGAQAILLAARIRSLMAGRKTPSIDDVRAVAPSALCHRVILNFEGEAEGVAVDKVLAQVLAGVPTD